MNLLKDADIVVARELIKEGYIKSELPVSKPAKNILQKPIYEIAILNGIPSFARM